VPAAACASVIEQRSAPPNRNDLVVGPLTLRGALLYARSPRSDFKPRHGRHAIGKAGITLQPRARVVLSIDRGERRKARLVYREKTRGAKRVSEADPALRFSSCFEDAPSTWPGGFIVTGPRCVTITLDIKGRREPVRREIAFGRDTCRSVE
jgi:hypothetical protein